MINSVFDYSSYKPYLLDRLGADNKRSGLKAAAAKAAGISSAFLSQVLRGPVQITVEQAEHFNDFFHHLEDEAEFFLLLVLKERSGHFKLTKRFQLRLDVLKNERKNLKTRLKDSKDLKLQEQKIYYSSYLYGAVYVLASLQNFFRPEHFAQALGVSKIKIQKVMNFLIENKILIEEDSRLKPGPKHIHLPGNSDLIFQHHLNWRLQALQKLDRTGTYDTRYSGVFSVSHNDVEKIGEKLRKNLQETLEVVSHSAEETAYVLNIDFFPLLNQ